MRSKKLFQESPKFHYKKSRNTIFINRQIIFRMKGPPCVCMGISLVNSIVKNELLDLKLNWRTHSQLWFYGNVNILKNSVHKMVKQILNLVIYIETENKVWGQRCI